MDTDKPTLETRTELTTAEIERAYRFLEEHERELQALLARCAQRRPRDEGIPAILILDDLTRTEKPTLNSAPGDEGRGPLYAEWALALAALIEEAGGDPRYPSICPAMSAIAEWRFSAEPFGACRGEEAG